MLNLSFLFTQHVYALIHRRLVRMIEGENEMFLLNFNGFVTHDREDLHGPRKRDQSEP